MDKRIELQRKLFPGGIPKLWCPTLSFFSAAGTFDARRIEEHLRRLSPFVRGILVPGSTGEGWEMSDDQIKQLLAIVLPIADQLGIHVLIGILKTETQQVLQAIDGLNNLVSAPAVVGITVCPAKGIGLPQADIRQGLAEVLKLDIPTALYQLPQVTNNEMSPDTVSELAAEYPNFILFKDTSGEDRVADSNCDLQGVFLVRGSEKGGYARWLRSVGGRYDGFLLSTANCFAEPLAQIVQHCEAHQPDEAERISQRLSRDVASAFELVSTFPTGNAFTNANKAIDHLRIYGAAFREYPGPMLISGIRLPMDVIAQIESALALNQIQTVVR